MQAAETDFIELECALCRRRTPHDSCGSVQQTALARTEQGLEETDGDRIEMLKCIVCERVSVWVMAPLRGFRFDTALAPIVRHPQHCLYGQFHINLPKTFEELKIDPSLTQSLEIRWREVQHCISVGATLAATILSGSILEGLLDAALENNRAAACQSTSAKRDRQGNVFQKFSDWTVEDKLNVAHTEKWISQQTKELAGRLRHYRNFVHPYVHTEAGQISEIDIDSCLTQLEVLRTAFNQLSVVLRKP